MDSASICRTLYIRFDKANHITMTVVFEQSVYLDRSGDGKNVKALRQVQLHEYCWVFVSRHDAFVAFVVYV